MSCSQINWLQSVCCFAWSRKKFGVANCCLLFCSFVRRAILVGVGPECTHTIYTCSMYFIRTSKSLRDTNSLKLIEYKNTDEHTFNGPFNYIDWWFSYWAIVVFVVVVCRYFHASITSDAPPSTMMSECRNWLELCRFVRISGTTKFRWVRGILLNSVDQTGFNFQNHHMRLLRQTFFLSLFFVLSAIFRCCFYRNLSWFLVSL